ncbi:MAG: PEP/pyruvate-binding domain-containing protein [Polyangiaceae bacterium]
MKVVTTEEIYAGTDYQPLNLGQTYGLVRILTAEELSDESTYVSPREIVVLDHVPNDISVVAGLITEEFQTPLSHVNVLAQTRGTPNMGLRKAQTNPDIKALAGKWAQLTVSGNSWSIKAADSAVAIAWWDARDASIPPIVLPTLNLDVKDLRDVKKMVDETTSDSLKVQIQTAIKAFGTKASNYGVLANTTDVPIRPAFGIPAFYYDQFMKENKLYDRVDAMLLDPKFVADPAERSAQLAQLRDDMINSTTITVNADFQALLKAKLAAEFPNQTMRFRTSTNAEDLDGFPCAGCYDSFTG